MNNTQETADKQQSRQNSLKSYNKKKRKKIIKTVIIIVIVALIVIFGLYKAGMFDKLLGKDEASASTLTTYALTDRTAYRTITKVLTSTGTIEPNEQYTITALVSGEILSDHFNKGDTVVEDQLLYEIESDSLDSNVTKARNSLKTAKTNLDEAYEKLEKLNVDSEVTGVIEKLHVEVGDEIGAGTLIADIIDSSTMILEVPFLDVDTKQMNIGDKAFVSFIDSPEVLEGVVDEISPVTAVSSIGATTRKVSIAVNNTGAITPSTLGVATVGDAVCTSHGSFDYSDKGSVYSEIAGDVSQIYFQEGQRINKGSILLRLESTSLNNQIESLEINVENAETNLEDALDAYDNYNITSPISGTVISKNYKAGDTIGGGGGNNSSSLAVIYDMSALKFTMSIDELDIDSLVEGQQVIITSDSREGQTYTGVVTNVSIQGTTTSGTTVYPVEVTIENVEDLSKRTVLEDGTVSKVYKTGMTSTENTYVLEDTSLAQGASVYTYSDGTVIKKVSYDGGYSLYIGDEKLNNYTESSYITGTSVYSFDDNFGTMTVEVRNEKKMLRPGMNIDAEIIVEKRENILAVPVTAIGRGNTVKVLKNTKADSADSADDKTAKEDVSQTKPNINASENMSGAPSFNSEQAQAPTDSAQAARPQGSRVNAYGTAPIDSEYEEVRVSVGISDEEYIEIIDGLEVGDVIIIENTQRTQSSIFGMMGMGGMPAMGMGGMPGGYGGGMAGGRNMGGNMGGGIPR